MPHRENINIVKREQRMTETFGHSNNFATLSPLVLQSETKRGKLLIFPKA